MTPLGAPPSRMRRVSRRVSTPAIPTMPCCRSQSSRCRAARQFDGSLMRQRSTSPRTTGVAVSISSSLVPTLPMCGKVKVMIWPA